MGPHLTGNIPPPPGSRMGAGGPILPVKWGQGGPFSARGTVYSAVDTLRGTGPSTVPQMVRGDQVFCCGWSQGTRSVGIRDSTVFSTLAARMGAYNHGMVIFCIGAYKHNVVIVIKSVAYNYGLIIIMHIILIYSMLSLPGFCLQVRITHSRTTSRICMPKNCHNYKTCCACLSMVSAFDVYTHTYM